MADDPRIPDADAPIAVLGAGVAGLAAALLLARRGLRVVVLERDEVPAAATPDAAFDWPRPGAPQFRHSHAFLGRLVKILRERFPDVLAAVRAAGGFEVGIAELARPIFGERWREVPGDEEVVLLCCRRATFEWVLDRVVRAEPKIEVRRGVRVMGLVATGAGGAAPRVGAVRILGPAQGEEVLACRWVVDASGRRSRTPQWLAALGVAPPREESVDAALFYYTRFYRLCGPRPAPSADPAAGDLGWIKAAVFPADRDAFSITLGVPARQAWLKCVATASVFEHCIGLFPALVRWRERGEPVGPVLGMGGLANRVRRFVEGGAPLVAGYFPIGDTAYTCNPIFGRGATAAFIQAVALDRALAAHPHDPAAAAVALDRRCRHEVEPFWDSTASSDRAEAMPPQLGDPAAAWVRYAGAQLLGWYFANGIAPATRADPAVFRAFFRMFTMLDGPATMLADPAVHLGALRALVRGAAGQLVGRSVPPPFRGPTRHAAMRALLGRDATPGATPVVEWLPRATVLVSRLLDATPLARIVAALRSVAA
jgi:2-polyprenyl-6-methoxyphenol hydroxylase-like FAD-dependent oxidoreductase